MDGSVSRLYRATPTAVGGPARYGRAAPGGMGKERGSLPVTDRALTARVAFQAPDLFRCSQHLDSQVHLSRQAGQGYLEDHHKPECAPRGFAVVIPSRTLRWCIIRASVIYV